MRETMAMFLEMNGSLSGGRGGEQPLRLPRKRFFLHALRFGLNGFVHGGQGRPAAIPGVNRGLKAGRLPG